MKKIIPIIALLLLVGCTSKTPSTMFKTDTVEIKDTDTVRIQDIVDWCNSDTLTVKEAQHLDSLNRVGQGLPVKCAERDLDTIINHYHIIFTTRRD